MWLQGCFRPGAQSSPPGIPRSSPSVPREAGPALPSLPLGQCCSRAHAASHDGAAVAAQRALEAQGGVHVFAAGAAHTLEQLAEEQQDVPVVLGRALHVAALPGLPHQVRHVPARNHASALQVALVAHDDDGRLGGADHPEGRNRILKTLPVSKTTGLRASVYSDPGVAPAPWGKVTSLKGTSLDARKSIHL